MNEVRALVEAFDEANIRGERCALATVVSVEGSSYRRPGARMLVCEGGDEHRHDQRRLPRKRRHRAREARHPDGRGEARRVQHRLDERRDGLGAGARLQRHRARAGRAARLRVALHRGAETFLRVRPDAAPVSGRDRVSVTPSRASTGARLFIDEDGEVSSREVERRDGRDARERGAGAVARGDVRRSRLRGGRRYREGLRRNAPAARPARRLRGGAGRAAGRRARARLGLADGGRRPASPPRQPLPVCHGRQGHARAPRRRRRARQHHAADD